MHRVRERLELLCLALRSIRIFDDGRSSNRCPATMVGNPELCARFGRPVLGPSTSSAFRDDAKLIRGFNRPAFGVQYIQQHIPRLGFGLESGDLTSQMIVA